MAEQKIRIRMANDRSDTAYIALPGYPEHLEPGIVGKTLDLNDLVGNYVGPRIHLDFDRAGKLIGIEILV